MIQLPSKIRTTLFSVAGTKEPFQLFSHENDRLFFTITLGGSYDAFPCLGRSKQDVINGDGLITVFYSTTTIYGPEPVWFASGLHDNLSDGGIYLVHAVYRV